MKPTRILKRIGEERRTSKGHLCKIVDLYLCDNGVSYTRSGLAEASGVNYQTITSRVGRFGITHPVVLKPGRITASDMEEYSEFYSDLQEPEPYNTKNCQVNGINCAKYSKCQAQRIGLKYVDPSEKELAGKWEGCTGYKEPDALISRDALYLLSATWG